MRELLLKLCALPGVSGFEGPVRDFIAGEIRPHVSQLEVDGLGNLIGHKKGRQTAGKKLLLTAHMDEVGFLVKYIDKEGFLRFAPVGGIDRRTVLGKRVLVGEKGIPGVIGLKAFHLLAPGEEKKAPSFDDLYIDIGAGDREEAEALTGLGDAIVFHSQPLSLGEDLFKAKAIDDRAGCAALICLLQEDLPFDCSFAFTVQEEVGTRGALGAAFSLKPDLALVLEGTTAADFPPNPPARRVTRLGAGPVIGLADRGTLYDRGLFHQLQKLAQAFSIPWQTKGVIAGGTDASAIQRSRAGVRVAALSVPVRYIHTGASVASWQDCQHLLTLARLFLKEGAWNHEREEGE